MKNPGIPCLLQMAAAKVTDCSGWTRCFLMHTPKSRCCALSSRNSAHTQQLFKRHQTVQDDWATFLTKARGWGWQCRLRNCLKAQAVRCTHSPTLLLAWHPRSVFNSRNDCWRLFSPFSLGIIFLEYSSRWEIMGSESDRRFPKVFC